MRGKRKRRRRRRKQTLKMTESWRESYSETCWFNRWKLSRVYTGFPKTGRRYIFSEIGTKTRWMRADAIEKLLSSACSWHRFTADWGCKNRRTRPSTSGRPAAGPRRGPVVGRNPLVSGALKSEGSAPAAHCGVWPSVCRLNRKNDFCPRAHYCLPLLLLLCASCAVAIWSTECNDEESPG